MYHLHMFTFFADNPLYVEQKAMSGLSTGKTKRAASRDDVKKEAPKKKKKVQITRDNIVSVSGKYMHI